MCSFVAIPFDILSYPLIDINLALFLHNLFNAVIQVVIGIPYTTVARCGLASDNSFKILMCTPDIAPVFQYFIASSTSLGLLVDNWLNILLLIVQQALTGNAPVCETMEGGLITDIMTSADIFGGTDPVSVIGLTGWIYAITNGRSIIYKGHSDLATKYGTWPYNVNPAYGIAAVSYSKVNEIDVSAISDGTTFKALQTTALMGCNCSDVDTGGIVITCAVASMKGWTTDNREKYKLQVLFPNKESALNLHCDWIDLHVKSNRFSFQRYSSVDINYGEGTTAMPDIDCISRGDCREVDASVWVVPRCGQDIGVVIPECVFGASCFPYCMGVRMSGATNNNIVLSSALQWKSGKTLIDRDCNIYNTDGYNTYLNYKPGTSYVQGQGTVLGTSISSTMFSSKSDPSSSVPECYPVSNVISQIPNTDFMISKYNTYSNNQPFVIAGDAVFTAKDLGGGVSSVVIDRFESDQKNEFTMRTLNQDFPAEAPPNVPQDETRYLNQDRILLPYSTRMGHPVATSSRNYVFYATNPDYGVFSAYLDYCNKPKGELGKFGLLITSSYGPLRIYRVKAYAKCSMYSCGAGLVKSIDFDGFKTNYDTKCGGSLNISISQLEYLNEDNIIVVVSSASVKSFSTASNSFSETKSQVYWLNPATMQVSKNIWQTAIAASSAGTLCPGLQRLPRLGSMFSEVLNFNAYVVQYIIGLPLYLPGVINIWLDGGKCPMQSYGHSILHNCGNDILSLENAFDSITDAAALFWHALNSISYMVQLGNPPRTNPVSDILDGMAMYGEGTIDWMGITSSVITISKIPLKEQIPRLIASVQSGSIFSSINNAQGNTIMWARFIYNVMAEIIIVILKSSLINNKQTSDDIWQTVWNTLYNLKDYYKETVVQTNQLGCSGIKLMMGLDNPWATLAYYYCAASVGFVDQILDTMLDITVYIPMSVCVCKNSVGYNPVDYAIRNCAPTLPLKLRPQLFIMSAYLQNRNTQDIGATLCDTVLNHTRNKIIHSMDPWFSNMNLAIGALAEAIDFILIFFDVNAGKCMDFQGNPHVISIIPQPIDYFQSCGKTSSCKMKCSAEWQLFEEYKTTPVQLATVSVDYESMFFPGQYDSTNHLQNAVALLEITSNSDYCQIKNGPQDYILLITEVIKNTAVTSVWCIPQSPTDTVYTSETPSSLATVALPGSVMQSYFVSEHFLCFLLRVGSSNQVYFVIDSTFIRAPDVSLDSTYKVVNIMNIWPIMNTVFIDVIVRRYENSIKTFTPVSYMFNYYWDTKLSVWVRVSNMDISSFADNYKITQSEIGSTSWEYLLIPTQSFLQAYHLIVTPQANGDVTSQLNILTSFDPTATLSVVNDNILSSHIISNTYVFAVAPKGWDWLHQVRFQVVDNNKQITSIQKSTVVSMSVIPQGNCDERSCEGCKSVLVQRLCQAYNKCALVRCIGTLVNEMRPLCAIGQTLSFRSSLALQEMYGAWVVLAEMLCTTLRLSLATTSSLNVEWPDDVFMGYICNAKDITVEFWAIFTSLINVLMHLVHTNPAHAFRGASQIDKNVDAALTIRSTALNGFLAQITMFPIYSMIAIKQIVMCQINGVLAITDVTGYSIRIVSPDLVDATSVAVGACLTVSNEIASQQVPTSPSATGLYGNMVRFIGNAVSFVVLQGIDPFIHAMDALITYSLGNIHTLAVLIMSFFPGDCNPPDYFLSETIQCACDDYRLTIPSKQANAPITEYPLWCTGTLGMIDSNNNPVTIVNPYSYAELQKMSSGLDAYVTCLSSSYVCNGPQHPDFERQGVTLTNVLMKCRENYMKKQWDPKAYAFFNPSSISVFSRLGRVIQSPNGAVKDCLIYTHANAAGPQACQEQYINSLNLRNPEEYWTYERATQAGPEYTDSCVVFTGPGAVHNIPAFAACIDGETPIDTNCTLNAQIWSASSANDIPIAEPHIVLYKGDQMSGVVQKYYKQARDHVTNAVMEAIYAWGNESNPDVQVDFFSTEGDAIHQIMDCIFMGPYSRVDYWPTPPKKDNEETLQGPAWYRDDNGGASRSIDIDTCNGGETMPFSCGSGSRRSVIRYFVKQVLASKRKKNGNQTLIQKVVLAELRDILSQWSNTSYYGCICVDNTYSPHCCDENSSNWLPDAFQHPFHDIHSDNVLDAIQDDYDEIYNLTMQNTLPWKLYNIDEWNNNFQWTNSERAKKEGLFNPMGPNNNYDDTLDLDTDQTMLWGVCHASLKQVFFTVPVSSRNIKSLETLLLYDGDPQKLESSIQTIVETALEDSPVYRHYYARYHPSSSLMCDDPSMSTTTEPMGSSQFDTYTQAGFTLLDQYEVLDQTSSIPTWNYKYLAMGNRSCTCGWKLDLTQGKCIVPTTSGTCTKVCGIVTCSNCAYDIQLDEQVYVALDTTWFCPMFQFSPHWGITDDTVTQAWMEGSQTLFLSSRDLLKYGRSGLRLGNIKSINKKSMDYVHPNQRNVSLDKGRLLHCDYHKKLQHDPMYLANELFPVVHGISEGAVASYCLRYFIEKARYIVLNLTHTESSNVNFTEAYLKQEELMYSWGRKCGSQLHLLHLCVSLNVFQPAIAGNSVQLGCPYMEVENEPNFYTTPNCLVFINGDFYDPCRCLQCTTYEYDGSVKLKLDKNFLLSTPSCKLNFNPIKKATNLNAPIGWWDGESIEYLDYLNLTLLEYLLDTPDAVGNTPPSKSWKFAEGYMEEEAESCDMMMDYWPDSMDYPVGYHVSTSCDAEDTAYRSFMNAFTIEQDNTVLKYQNDIMRDMQDVDQLYGVGGLCRQNNFGMDMHKLNTMIYCTRVRKGERVDYTIPGFNNNPENNEFSQEACSSDSTELPWDQFTENTKYASYRISIGTVPNLPGKSSTTYPESLSDMIDITSQGNILKSWDYSCGDYKIHYCTTSTPCPTGYTCRGRRCSGSQEYLKCTQDSDCGDDNGICQGVCMQATVDCIRHSDCKENPVFADMMCDGMGQCVDPTIVINNNDPEYNMKVEFQVQGSYQTTLGATYSLLGGSYWGYMGADLLKVHGMCSFKDWYVYDKYYKQNCGAGSTADVCWIDPSTKILQDLSLSQAEQKNYWWSSKEQEQPKIMYIRPTNCDRDYERLDGFTLHRPALEDVIFTQQGQVVYPSDPYENYTRAYSKEGMSNIPLFRMDTSYAGDFLFGSKLRNNFGPGVVSGQQNFLQPCSTIRQCLKSPFTRNFIDTIRTIKENSIIKNYNLGDNFICGAIGFLNSNSMCDIDTYAFPLYSFFCVNEVYKQSRCFSLGVVISTVVTDVCSTMTSPYKAAYNNIVANVEGLKSLFYIFENTIQDVYDVMRISDCAVDMYAHIKTTTPAKSLYYPFPFVIQELPYDFFYQCLLLTSNFIIRPDYPEDQVCAAYKQKKNKNNVFNPNIDLKDYLKIARKGFSWTKLTTYTQNNNNLGLQKLKELSKYFTNVYPDKTDQSRPLCATRRIWKFGLHPLGFTLIDNFLKSSNCQQNRINQLIALINSLNTSTEFTKPLDVQEIITLLNLKNQFISYTNTSIQLPMSTSTWSFLLSETDLDEQRFNLLSIQNERIAVKTMLETVLQDMQKNWYCSQVPKQDKFRFVYNISLFNPQNMNMEYELNPEMSTLASIVTDKASNNFPRCMYNKKDDPAFKKMSNLENCITQSNKIISCNGIECSQLTSAFSHTGKFYCHYHYLDKLNPTLDVANATEVYKFMYNYLLSNFKLNPQDFILEEFEFFTDTNMQSDWVLNFANTLNYIANNQPDTSKTVMCSISDSKLIDYAKCTHPHWNNLKNHVEKYYYHQGGIKVEPNTQMQWNVKSSMFYSGFITTFSSSNKTHRQVETYLNRLFNENTACKTATPDDAVCYKFVEGSSEKIDVINPWLHGYYNPYSYCDVSYSGITQDSTEYIDTYIYPENFNDGSTPVAYPKSMPWGDVCLSKRKELVTKPSPSRFNTDQQYMTEDSKYNLCHHLINDGLECYHVQGILGNDNGMPVGAPDYSFNMFFNTEYTNAYNAYKVASTMYTNSHWEIPLDYQNGLYGDTNPLWSGYNGLTGFLKVPDYELGIHSIEMTIERPEENNITYDLDTFFVSKLPLSSKSRSSSQKVETWVPNLIRNIQDDHNAYTASNLDRMRFEEDVFDVGCAHRRLAFHTENNYSFQTMHPNPTRSKFLFAKINRNTNSHPTMTHNNKGEYLGKYTTVNGFCFCPFVGGIMQTQCKIPLGVTSTCSLDHTINTLKATEGEWWNSYVFISKDQYGNDKRCTMQLDWPFLSNPLRDGSLDTETYSNYWSYASDSANKKCHVLDRFAVFQYRYKDTKVTKSSGKNTISHGVCKTGRVSTYTTANKKDVRCTKSQVYYNQTSHYCDDSPQVKIMQRKTALDEREMFRKYKTLKRSKCNTCSKPPTFVDAKNNKITPESSFGVPYRLSASKMLAYDLRTTLEQGNIPIDETYWSNTLFLKTYLQKPHLLIKKPAPSTSTPPLNWKIDDTSRWKKPWVYCSNADAFKNNSCTGVIERKDWVERKTSVCPATIKTLMQTSKQDPMSRTSFATIDKHTNKVAQAIQDAREMIINANCIAAGMSYCLPRPFTYHPATYETTNRAWIHDTVVQYYKSIDTTSCSAHESSQAFLTYLKEKQTHCPANVLYLFEMIFIIIRQVITDVALLLASVFSVLFKLIASIWSTDAKLELHKEWVFLKSKFNKLFSNLSDLLVNMLMNSGELGATLMTFVKTVCKYVNFVLTWFVDIWCVYVQKYLITFMELAKKFYGYTEGFFRVIGEFIEFLLRYYLPISILKSYASTAVQTAVIDKYGQADDKSEKNQQKMKVVKNQPISNIAKESLDKPSYLNRAKTWTKNVLLSSSSLYAMGGAIALASVDMIIDSIAESDRGGIIDSIWTPAKKFFDFKFIVNAADNIIYFLSNDEKCAQYTLIKKYSNDSDILRCPKFDIDPLGSENPSKSIAPTLCWASSNPTLGESSMYSCTASSTCCPATGCSSSKSNNVLCNSCPYPTSPDISRFACDNQVCKCSVPVQKTSLCQSNGFCDATSYCDLISVISSVSFGTLPCKECPGKVMCISDNIIGRCGCIMDKTVNMAMCLDNPGTVINPNPMDLCGYIPRLASTSTQTSFQYQDLMGVLCSRSTRTICATVIMNDGYSTRMPVSYVIRVSQNARRRLLVSDDDLELTMPSIYTYENEYDSLTKENVHHIMHLPNWNLSSAPCSTLAMAYQHNQTLGILELHELHKCAYWRHVGRDIIQQYNMTSLAHIETFLLSMDDLSAALTHKNVAWEFLAHPYAMLQIMLMHPWLKPVRALAIIVGNLMERVEHVNHTNHDDHLLKTVQTHIKNHPLPSKKYNKTNEQDKIKVLKQFFTNKTRRVKLKQQKTNTTNITNTKKQDIPSKASNMRKLLATLSEIEAVKQYSSDIISGKINPPISLTMAQSWLRGPYSWPPKYEYSISTCPIIIITKDSALEIFSVLALYFKHMDDDRPPISRSLRHNLPQFIFPVENKTNILYNQKSWPSWIYYNVLKQISLDPHNIEEFFVGKEQWSLLWIMQSTLMCDFGSAMSCSRHNKDLFASVFVFLLFYFIIKVLADALGSPILATLFFLSFPLFILWYTYGFSPNCLPMLPTCVFTDVINLITDMFPVRYEFPELLYCTNNFTVVETSCLKSCSEIGFNDSIDALAYSLCSLDNIVCDNLVQSTNNSFFFPVSQALNKWNRYTSTKEQRAYSFCSWIEGIKTVPYVLFFMILSVAISVGTYAIIALIPIFINVVSQILAYNHTH